MDNFNRSKNEMAGTSESSNPVNIRVHAKSLPGLYDSPGEYSHISTSEVEERGTVFIHQDPDVELSDMEVSIQEAKMYSDKFHLKNEVPKMLEQISQPGGNMTGEIDINKKLAVKKVEELHVETTNEAEVVPPELGCRAKKQSKKRTFDEMKDARKQDVELMPETAEILRNLKAGKLAEKVWLTFNHKCFSSIDNLEVDKTPVGAGSFGTVYKAQDSVTKQRMAVKKFAKNYLGKLEENEILIPIQLPDVENISQIFGMVWNGNDFLIIMEDAGFSLRTLIKSEEFLTMLYKKHKLEEIMLGIFYAISRLAKLGVTHCDLKPENICYNFKTGMVKLIDFGSCHTGQDCYKKKEMKYRGLSPEYLDPQANKAVYNYYRGITVVFQHKFGEKDDVFAAGLVGLFLLKQAIPFVEYFTKQADYPRDPKDPKAFRVKRLEIMKQISELTEDQMIELLHEPMSATMKELLTWVLKLERGERWEAQEAVKFLREKLDLIVQPRKKMAMLQPQPCCSWTVEQPPYVDLREKNSDQIAATKDKKQELMPESSNTVQKTGMPFKRNAVCGQTGGALTLASHKVPSQQGAATQISVTSKFPHASLYQQQPSVSALHSTVKEESIGRNDLMSSVHIKHSENLHYFVPFHMSQSTVLPGINPGSPVQTDVSLGSAVQTDINTRGSVQTVSNPRPAVHPVIPVTTFKTNANPRPAVQLVNPNSTVQNEQKVAAVQSLSDKVTGEGSSGAGPPFGTEYPFGNVPDLDALLRPSEEQVRTQGKGKHCSQSKQFIRD